MPTLTGLDRAAPLFVAGHRGFVGSAVWRCLTEAGFTALIGAPSTELDLRDRDQTFDFFATHQPSAVVLAAAKVGGIQANLTEPTAFLSENLRIQVNVLDAAHAVDTERLLLLGSTCVYPKHAEQPIRESSLLTGPVEPTSEAYAIAKIAGIQHVQALRRQYGRRYIAAMSTNLYGPHSNFDPDSSHVIPGMIRRFHEAVRTGAEVVTCWGSGSPRREFLHVDDAARACLHVLDHYDSIQPVNIGTGEDMTIRDLATTVARVVGFHGRIEWDTARPDGASRKLVDGSTIRALGWRATTSFTEGVADTYAWFLRHNRMTTAT